MFKFHPRTKRVFEYGLFPNSITQGSSNYHLPHPLPNFLSRLISSPQTIPEPFQSSEIPNQVMNPEKHHHHHNHNHHHTAHPPM